MNIHIQIVRIYVILVVQISMRIFTNGICNGITASITALFYVIIITITVIAGVTNT